MSDKTPEILWSATRQYRHNDGSDGFVIAFKKDETIEIVTKLQSRISELENFAGIVLQGWEGDIREWIDDGEPDDFVDRKFTQVFIDKFNNINKGHGMGYAWQNLEAARQTIFQLVTEKQQDSAKIKKLEQQLAEFGSHDFVMISKETCKHFESLKEQLAKERWIDVDIENPPEDGLICAYHPDWGIEMTNVYQGRFTYIGLSTKDIPTKYRIINPPSEEGK